MADRVAVLSPGAHIEQLAVAARHRRPAGHRRPSRTSSGAAARLGCSRSAACERADLDPVVDGRRADRPRRVGAELGDVLLALRRRRAGRVPVHGRTGPRRRQRDPGDRRARARPPSTAEPRRRDAGHRRRRRPRRYAALVTTTTARLALATCAELPDLDPDDHALRDALAERGIADRRRRLGRPDRRLGHVPRTSSSARPGTTPTGRRSSPTGRAASSAPARCSTPPRWSAGTSTSVPARPGEGRPADRPDHLARPGAQPRLARDPHAVPGVRRLRRQADRQRGRAGHGPVRRRCHPAALAGDHAREEPAGRGPPRDDPALPAQRRHRGRDGAGLRRRPVQPLGPQGRAARRARTARGWRTSCTGRRS